MFHRISWHITRHNWAWCNVSVTHFPITTNNKPISVLLCSPRPLCSPRRLWASVAVGCQTPSEPWREFMLETVSPVDLDTVGFNTPKPGAAFTASCISLHLFRREILEFLKKQGNYNKILKIQCFVFYFFMTLIILHEENYRHHKYVDFYYTYDLFQISSIFLS